MLKPAIPNVFVEDLPTALVSHRETLGFQPMFVYGDLHSTPMWRATRPFWPFAT